MRMVSFARRHPWIGLPIVVTIAVASWMLLRVPHPATEPVSLAASPVAEAALSAALPASSAASDLFRSALSLQSRLP